MLKISFDFDEKTQKVSNFKVINASLTTSANCDVYIDENKLKLSDNLLNAINAVPGDRISINYWTVNNTETYPIISKAEVFTDGSDGTKLTKSNTISFKGHQRDSLIKFGNQFVISEFKDKNGNIIENAFKLEPIDTEENLNDEESIVNLDESEFDKVIDDITLEDTLPF